MVRLKSRLLGGDIVICIEDDEPPPDTSHVVYTRTEILALATQGEEAVRIVHEMKRVFGGTYIPPGTALPVTPPRPAAKSAANGNQPAAVGSLFDRKPQKGGRGNRQGGLPWGP